ncbi:hypothetical protein LINPERHAP1_LOCUS5357 [Linum perenne]
MKFSIVYDLTNKLRNPPCCQKDGTTSCYHTLFLSSTVQIMFMDNH